MQIENTTGTFSFCVLAAELEVRLAQDAGNRLTSRKRTFGFAPSSVIESNWLPPLERTFDNTP
jgi:hypothetical protein